MSKSNFFCMPDVSITCLLRIGITGQSDNKVPLRQYTLIWHLSYMADVGMLNKLDFGFLLV